VIELAGLCRRFGDVVAVDDVSLRCEDGEVTGLLGPNGAGKTTVLRLLGGLLTPDSGHAAVDGLRIADGPFEARRGLAMLPDARGLYPRLTAREHVAYFARLHGVDDATTNLRLARLAADIDMNDLLDRRVSGFSQGERMKVLLARALVHEPRNVVLDEPTNGLDVMSRRAVRELLLRLRDEGRCVLLSSHVMQEMAALCDRIYVMARGTIVAEGTREELLDMSAATDLEDAFVKLVSGPIPTDDEPLPRHDPEPPAP